MSNNPCLGAHEAALIVNFAEGAKIADAIGGIVWA